jgi:hypothetical protein
MGRVERYQQLAAGMQPQLPVARRKMIRGKKGAAFIVEI